MHIKINKDFETTYKDEMFRGLSSGELGAMGAGIVAAGAAIYLIATNTGLPLNVCVYGGVPFALPFLVMGFARFQGLTAVDYLKELIFAKRTAKLLYDADEMPKNISKKSFTIHQKKKKACARIRHTGNGGEHETI